ncbi:MULTISPECIES: PTS sugar transporter subunit IIA [Virgibacillus]|uniref:EIICBA-Glc 2 n=2 Tax=Virgibacillus TaxID=84406 RepID=A0A024Q729_9BACI|nr:MULTISPECIES: PTS glucose transporter subunit IIA [Virgibacillus]EQB38398.1 hypothetical protein M948_07400 [Virgibacillus sp. CM-4]MYL41104.1 PTS glucose transporter subunit IIA [Virgibacillus massiliensis]GGJ54298.1 PTS glucose transporter subunit IIA [Virgibacillus kapii]CDQ38092.1 EIICBA-Glc 2 [Virgibacillus massiliensis]
MFKNLFKKSKDQHIYAPVNGKIVSLENVPDPVFSQKMMGEGIAILPSDGKIAAPFDGKVVQIPETKHAIGLVTDEGLELLIHVGLETVGLKGEGFRVEVNTGDTVSKGQLLMEADLPYIKEHAADIITPIIITNSNDLDKQFTYAEETVAKQGETMIITLN